MISFDLKCALGHVFEVWFRSSSDYEAQRSGGLIGCPLCGNADVAKAVMAPAVGAKGNQRSGPSDPQPIAPPQNQPMVMPGNEMDEARFKEMLGALAEAQAKMLEQSQWVGNRFADKARAMHYGDIEQAPIHGTTNPDEARAMLEEGLAVAPLIVPVVGPDRVN